MYATEKALAWDLFQVAFHAVLGSSILGLQGGTAVVVVSNNGYL